MIKLKSLIMILLIFIHFAIFNKEDLNVNDSSNIKIEIETFDNNIIEDKETVKRLLKIEQNLDTLVSKLNYFLITKNQLKSSNLDKAKKQLNKLSSYFTSSHCTAFFAGATFALASIVIIWLYISKPSLLKKK